MRLRTATEQQQEALWRVFLMFVVIALVIIRAGLVCRSALAAVSPDDGPQDARPGADRRPPLTSQADLYRAALVVLSLAAAAGRRFVLAAHALWDRMNQPLRHPRREPRFIAANLCECRVQRLDTS